MSRPRWPLAALVLLALIVVGCSNAPAGAPAGAPAESGTGSSGNTIAVTFTAPTDTAPADTAPTATAPADAGNSGGNTTAANHEQAVKFATCMRNNGVPNFPDPDASGELTRDGVINGSSLDPSSAAWQKAIDACKDLQPAGFTGHKRSPQEQEAALKFAQCIRDNGVPDFPDPSVDAPLIDTNKIPSAAGNGGMSILRDAMQKCRGAAAAAEVTGGK